MTGKILYVLLAHANFEQTMRLFDRLDRGEVSFVFHISQTCEPQFFEKIFDALKDRSNCYFARRAYVRWGDFGMVQGVLNAIDTICENQLDFDYAILLSGQDYPLKSHQTICQTFDRSDKKQFLEVISFDTIKQDLAYRIETYHIWLGKRHFWFPHQNKNNLLATITNLIISLGLFKKQKPPHGYTPYKGSFWWNLTKDCIYYIHQHIHSKIGRDLIKFFEHTNHSGESYFQTILMNSKYKDKIVNKDFRFVLWLDPDKDKGHPILLTTQYFNDIASTECLFGRKFDMKVDAEILDQIDKIILAPPKN